MSIVAGHMPSPGDEQGFTIIELLVAILTGLVVVFALFSVLEVALRQTSQLSDNVQADTVGRGALTTVVDELHSACIAHEFAPIQSGSTASEIRFRSGYGEGTVIEGGKAFEHRIQWTGTWPNSGKLVDKSYASSGSWPNLTFEATPKSSVILAEHVYKSTETGPIFQYEDYSTKAEDNATSGLDTLTTVTPGSSGLTSAQAKTIAAVLVTFTTAPSDNNIKLFRGAEFSNLVTFAFAAPASEATIVDSPCQ
jgi:Tfp pilus assembly protein PilW